MRAKELFAVFASLVLAGLLASGASFAAEDPVCKAPHFRSGRAYDPKTVETVSGEVVKVERTTSRRGRTGIHLVLKTEKEETPVYLGPSRFLEKQEVKVAQGDRIDVKGSRIEFKGTPAIVAAEVRKGDSLLKLRDENGVPAWSRRKAR